MCNFTQNRQGAGITLAPFLIPISLIIVDMFKRIVLV